MNLWQEAPINGNLTYVAPVHCSEQICSEHCSEQTCSEHPQNPGKILAWTPLILSESQFYRICRRNCAKWSNMSRKMTSDLVRSCSDGFVNI